MCKITIHYFVIVLYLVNIEPFQSPLIIINRTINNLVLIKSLSPQHCSLGFENLTDSIRPYNGPQIQSPLMHLFILWSKNQFDRTLRRYSNRRNSFYEQKNERTTQFEVHFDSKLNVEPDCIPIN